MHPLYCALLIQSVPLWVTLGALAGYRYTYAPPRCRTSQYRLTFIFLAGPLSNDLADLVIDGVGLVDFKSKTNAFLLALSGRYLFVLHCFPFVFFLSMGWYHEVRLAPRTDRLSSTHSWLCDANFFK